MIAIRRSEERGHTKIDWLNSYHSFSFGEYYDPQNIHFGPLRVLNEDTVSPSGGFPTHPHKDMEIVSIVFEGVMAHRDSTGTQGAINSSDVQRMSAGSGIFHSEFNASDSEFLHFCQIWFIPNKTGITPSYEQIAFDISGRKNNLQKVVSGEKENGVIFINQDAKIYMSDLDAGNSIKYNTSSDRGLYIYNVKGEFQVNNTDVKIGDGAKVVNEDSVNISAKKNSKLLLFDLVMNF